MQPSLPDPSQVLTPAAFRALRRDYAARTGCRMVCVNNSGAIFYGRPPCRRCGADAACHDARRNAIAEAWRWGEPCLGVCPAGLLLWAVPLTINALVLGGLVVVDMPAESGTGQPPARIRAAIAGLQELAERHNLVNDARMRQQRQAAQRERDKAEAIHAAKTWRRPDARLVYLREEPALLSAVRDGNADQARGAICRVLAGIPPDDFMLAQNIGVELTVMCCRTALETAADQATMAGVLRNTLTGMAMARDMDALREQLERVPALLAEVRHPHPHDPAAPMLARAMDYIRRNLDQEITRDGAARAAGMSPSHFSRMLSARTGRAFTQILADLRVNRARELLAGTDKSLVHIAFECGFSDQSYFTRVFRKITGATPADYRRHNAGHAPPVNQATHGGNLAPYSSGTAVKSGIFRQD